MSEEMTTDQKRVQDFLARSDRHNITLDELGDAGLAFVRSVGWDNKSELEILALICSELVEALESATEGDFEVEVADVFLRTTNYLRMMYPVVHIDSQVRLRVNVIRVLSLGKDSIKSNAIAKALSFIKEAMNASRKMDEQLTPDMVLWVLAVMHPWFSISTACRKLELSVERGTRGRVK